MKKLSMIKDYLLELAFLALLVRVVAVGCGIGEALALVSVVSSMGYNKWLAKSKVTEREELEAKWQAAFLELSDELKATQNKVSSLSVNQTVRRTTPNEPQALPQLQPNGTPKRWF
jgi:hypothetical protein